MTFNAIKVVMITAWRKCQDGYYSDAKEILHCLLQEQLLDVSKKEFTLESNMLLSEIYLLFFYYNRDPQGTRPLLMIQKEMKQAKKAAIKN